jgi:hypothetical protein
MRNMLAFLAALTLTVGGIGWYRDWFHIQSQPTAPGTRSVEIDINTKKIGEDLRKGEEKLIQKAEQKVQEKKSANGGSNSKDATNKEAPAKTGLPY